MTLKFALDAVTDNALSLPTIVGSVVIVMRGGDEVYRRAAGYFDREAGTPMSENAIFRLASFTKPLVAAAELRMIETGLLALNQPVSSVLPDFTPAIERATKNQIGNVEREAGSKFGYFSSF